MPCKKKSKKNSKPSAGRCKGLIHMNYDKVNIYFDTNSLEDYLPRTITAKGNNKSFMKLSEFRFPSYYYDIEKFIQDNELRDKIEILIPEIVWMELEKHLINQHKQDLANLSLCIDEYKNIFSDLIEINYEIKEKEYKKYLSGIMADFLENPKISAKIINCPKDSDCITKIIRNAMYTVAPFSEARKDKKDYSDAGFKDALIVETVLANKNDNILTIFVSKDNDFKKVFENQENIIICNEDDQNKRKNKIIEILSEQFVIQEEIIKKEISQNNYMLEELIAQTGLDTKLDYRFGSFESIKEQIDEEDESMSLNVWDVIFTMYVGEQLYKFQITYDGYAHGLESGEIIDE